MSSPDLLPEHVENCQMIASRELILEKLPQGGTAAEVGVAAGYYTEKILKEIGPEKLYAIDLYNYPRVETELRSHEDFYRDRFEEEVANDLLVIKKGLSWDVLATFPDNHFDYIYLDADHTYESVSSDLAVIEKKLKPSCILQCNDNTTFNPIALMAFGVQRAVNEFMIAHNFEMLFYSLDKNNFCDVVLKKMD